MMTKTTTTARLWKKKKIDRLDENKKMGEERRKGGEGAVEQRRV